MEIFSATSTVAYAVLLTKSSKSKKSDGLLPVRLGLQKNGREPNRIRWAAGAECPATGWHAAAAQPCVHLHLGLALFCLHMQLPSS